MKKLTSLLLIHKLMLAAIVLTLLGIIPLLHAGLPPTHDGEYHVIRFYEFYKAFTDGDFYPRWATDLNNGFGVPLFNYVYPFPNYVATVFHYLGFSFIDAFKLNMFIATLVGVLFFYLWSKHFWHELGGVIAAVSYAFAPYRFVDIYIRGSVGEVWALAFFPAILWSITKLSRKNIPKNIILSGIFFAFIIFSHNILAVMFTIFTITYCIFLLWSNQWRRSIAVSMIASGAIGVSLSAVFWLPALLETKYVRGLVLYTVEENFPDLYQLLIPSWGSGFSSGDLQNQMSFQIGLVPIMFVFLSIISLFIPIRNNKREYSSILFFLGWFFLTVFLMLPISSPVWMNLPLLNYFQFPWRFLSITILCTSFLSGAVIAMFSSHKIRLGVTVILILLNIMLTIGYIKPAYYHDRDDAYYVSRANFIDGTNSPGDLFNTKWMGKSDKINHGVTYLNGTGKITPEIQKTSYKKYTINSDTDSFMQAKLAYFPGWTVFLDGEKQDPSYTKNGLLTFTVKQGKHTIEIIFLDTIIRQTANMWTLATTIIILAFLTKQQIKKILL